MSWDFYMEIDIGDDNPIWITPCEANYTYNVSNMFYDAFDLEKGIRGLDGMEGAKAEPLLYEAIMKMLADPSKYKAMNPKNGWGNYEGALELLRKLHMWCREAPKAILRVT